MGFTPLEGLIMGTRSGDLDPAILPYIMQKENLNSDEMNNVLNKNSGVYGISGVSSDFRILKKLKKKNKRADLALRAYAHRVRKYIGAYFTELYHVDGIVFTAGLGENSPEMRE